MDAGKASLQDTHPTQATIEKGPKQLSPSFLPTSKGMFLVARATSVQLTALRHNGIYHSEPSTMPEHIPNTAILVLKTFAQYVQYL